MNLIKYILIICLVVLIPFASATLTTNNPINVTTNEAVLNGNTTVLSTVWFEWGRNPSTFIYKTENQTINGSFSSIVSGMPIMSNTQYFYRAVASNGSNTFYGQPVSFTTLGIGEIPDNDFDAHFDNLTNTSLDPVKMSAVAAAPYIDILGNVFWGILFSGIFIFLWMRQEDITIPSLVGLIIGGSLWTLMPQDWVSMAMSLTVVSFGGLVYSLIKGRS